MRPTGTEASSPLVTGLSGGFWARKPSVAIGPGATQLTVMPSRASSSAQVRVMPTTAALAAA